MGFWDAITGAGVGSIAGLPGATIGGVLGAGGNLPWNFDRQAQDPTTGYNPMSMYPQFSDPSQSINNDLSGIRSSQPYVDQFGKEASRTGPSQFANLAQGQQDKFATDAQSKAAGTAAGSAADARSQLAMRGGLDSGARERIAKNQSRDYMNMTQNVANNRANNGMQIGMNDEQNRIQQLGQMPQMQNQANQADFQKAGLDTQANTVQNAFNLQRYNTQMQTQGSMANAKATANSGGSSFICTALKRHGLMSKRESVVMTKFMLGSLATRADFFAWYFQKGEKAVEMAERQKYDFSLIKARYVDDIMELLAEGREEEAQDVYIKRAGQFVQQWLGSEASYDSSYEKKNILRSILSLPVVFALPSTWRWMRSFYGARIKRSFTRRFA